MKTRFYILLAAVLCLAACNKDKEELRHERDIVYTVAEETTTVHLTTEAEWQQLLDHFCDYAEGGSSVTFRNAKSANKSATKETVTYSTTDREEMKRWMAQMEDEGMTVTVSYDPATGTWNGTAYATAPQPRPESQEGCHSGVLTYDGNFITANDETLTLDNGTYHLGDSATLCGNSVWNQDYYGEYFYCLVLDYTWLYPSTYANLAPVYIGYADNGTFIMSIDTLNRLIYSTSTLDDQGWQSAIGGGKFSYTPTGETDAHGGRIIEVSGASTEGNGLRFSLQWHSDGSLTFRDPNHYPADNTVHTLGEVTMQRTNDYETYVYDGAGYNVVLHIFCGACVPYNYGYSSEPFYVNCITPFRTGEFHASGFYDGIMTLSYGDNYDDPDDNYETTFNLEYHGLFRFTLTPTNYTDYCDPNWLIERK